jgi:hypothetical protein
MYRCCQPKEAERSVGGPVLRAQALIWALAPAPRLRAFPILCKNVPPRERHGDALKSHCHKFRALDYPNPRVSVAPRQECLSRGDMGEGS